MNTDEGFLGSCGAAFRQGRPWQFISSTGQKVPFKICENLERQPGVQSADNLLHHCMCKNFCSSTYVRNDNEQTLDLHIAAIAADIAAGKLLQAVHHLDPMQAA